MIVISDLEKIYASQDFSHTALSGVNLTIEDGDIFGILGTSGAGKSTLVRCLNLLEVPDSGTILIDGTDVCQATPSQLPAIRANMGMIFQNYCLFQQRDVLDNILFPLALRKRISREDRDFAVRLLERVGLSGYEHRYPSQLSGGQKQRVAICRALIARPSYLICDEATSALDSETTAQILELLRDINKDLGVTLILITHSQAVAQAICKHVAILEKGRIVSMGTPEQVLGVQDALPLTSEDR